MPRNISKPFNMTLSLIDIEPLNPKYKCFFGEDVQLNITVTDENRQPLDLSQMSARVYYICDGVDLRQDDNITITDTMRGRLKVIVKRNYIRVGTNEVRVVLYDNDQEIMLQPATILCKATDISDVNPPPEDPAFDYKTEILKVKNTSINNQTNIGDISTLKTTVKSDLVAGINELKDSIETNTSQLEQIKKNHLFYSVNDFGAKGDNITDDSLAIQNCINKALETGGIIYFPGNYKISNTITINTSTSGKYIHLMGKGIGSTKITTTSDITAFDISGYLYNVSDMVIHCGVDNSTKYGLRLKGGGRRELQRLQITSFYHNIYQDGSFDQFSIDKVNCSDSISHGFYLDINNVGSCALLRVTDSLFNNSQEHGCFINQNGGQLICSKFENTEFINNGKHGLYAESFSGVPITNITLDNVDIEHVKDGYSCVYFKNVYKFMINNLVVNEVSSGAEIITLKLCKDGNIITPWITDNTQSNKFITVNSSCENIYLNGGRKGLNEKISFKSNDNSIIPLSCINLDNLFVKNSEMYLMKKEFNTDLLNENISNKKLLSFEMIPDIQNSITVPYYSNRPLRTLRITWFNTTTNNTGNVSFACYNNSLEGNSSIYSFTNSTVDNQNVLKTTSINIGDITLDTNNGFTLFRILRNGSDNSDTFTGNIAICKIEFVYK